MSCAPDAARAAFVPLTDGEMQVRRGIRRTYPYDIFTCPNFSIRHLSFPNHLFLPSYAPYLPAREDGWGLVLPRGRGLPEPCPLEGWSFGFRPPRRYCENGEYSRRRGRANRVHIGPWRKGGHLPATFDRHGTGHVTARDPQLLFHAIKLLVCSTGRHSHE